MNVRHLLFIILLTIYGASSVHAQKQSAISDSLWCDHLNEIIKCASIDEITDRIGNKDSSYINGRRPYLRLSNAPIEFIQKEYGKVNYVCYLYTGKEPDKELEKQFIHWYKKIKDCLSPWEVSRLKNADPYSPTVPDDYFFTNSEDETSVRLDIVKDKGYSVRLWIF
jgi:hypothetical protein